MSPLTNQIAQLDTAIAALDAQRLALGDAVIDASLATLRAQRDALYVQVNAQPTSLERQLSHLTQVDLIRLFSTQPELAYWFKHALTQEAAYDSLLVKDRREIHRQVAQAYEHLYAAQLDEHAPLLAHHFGHAGDDAKWADYAMQAGEAAARAYALPEAVQFYAQALAGLARLPDTVAHRRQRIDLTMKRAPIAWITDTPERNFARLEEAETLARSLTDETGQSEDRLRLARMHYLLASEHMAHNEPGSAIRYLEQVEAEARDLGDAELLTVASVVMGATRSLCGYFTQAETLLRTALDQMDPTASFSHWEWTGAIGYLSLTLAARGRLAEGLDFAERGFKLMREAHNQTHLALLEAMQGLAFMLGGDSNTVLDMARAGLVDAEQSGSPMYRYFDLIIIAWAESRLGQHAAARESLARLRAVAQMLGPRLLLGDWLASAEAELALNAGQPSQAAALAEQAVNFARSIDGRFAEGWALRVWGQALTGLGLRGDTGAVDWASAEAHLASSLELFEAGGAVIEAARTRMALGGLFAARGDGAAARTHLQQAAAQFEACGLKTELDQTRELSAALD